MTEEIIIDGVNVSACRFFTEDLFHPLTNSDCSAHCTPYPECACYDTCDEHPDCYYKQLKRLEQENKELKEQLLEDKILDEHIESLSREDIYRSALEEIRDYINTLSSVDSDFTSTETYLRIQNKINEVLK